MQVERVEHKLDQHFKRFRRKTVSPRVSTKRKADFGSSIPEIDVEERTGSEHFVSFPRADPPLEEFSRSEELMDLLD